jgi:hypothetical protein
VQLDIVVAAIRAAITTLETFSLDTVIPAYPIVEVIKSGLPKPRYALVELSAWNVSKSPDFQAFPVIARSYRVIG